MYQQACGGNLVVDDVQHHRHLHQRLALPADPLAAHVALDPELARLVVDLRGNVLADALQLTTATAGGR